MEVKQSGIIEQLDVHGHKERLDERDAFSEFVLPIFLSILNHLEPPSWIMRDHLGPWGTIRYHQVLLIVSKFYSGSEWVSQSLMMQLPGFRAANIRILETRGSKKSLLVAQHLSQIITALSHQGCKLASCYQQTFAETQSIANSLSALVIITQLTHLHTLQLH